MSDAYPVSFEPGGLTVWVDRGTTLLEAARAADLPLLASCGGRGTCGECAVRVTQGVLSEPTDDEAAVLRGDSRTVRLACRARVSGPVTVSPVSLASDSAWRVSPAAGGDLAAGVDLGTTNVSAAVVEIESGREIGRSTVPNLQASYGADVLTRISEALGGLGGELAAAAERSITQALHSAAGTQTRRISRVVLAGNTAMTALLVGADVSALSAAPFGVPPLPSDPPLAALKAVLAPRASVRLVPPLAAFVGGDLAAGLVALDATRRPGPTMLVDIGTNAEVAVVHGGVTTVASAPAGPAFEAVGIRYGGPAVPGAVVEVRRGEDGGPRLGVLGSASPRWFCGAGLLSAVAFLRETGHIDAQGVMSGAGEFAERVERDADGVVTFDFGAPGEPLRLTQLDVRAVQLAKGAVRVAIQAASRAAGVGAGQLKELWVAGAFGGALPARHLVSLGIVPRSAGHVVTTPGNTSLAGAVALALRPDWTEPMPDEGEGAPVESVDLPGDADFARLLMAALELSPYDV